MRPLWWRTPVIQLIGGRVAEAVDVECFARDGKAGWMPCSMAMSSVHVQTRRDVPYPQNYMLKRLIVCVGP